MVQCIAVMGAKAGLLYRERMPVRPHAAALFLCRSPGLDQAMTSDIESKFPVYAHPQRGEVIGPRSSFDAPTHFRIV